MGGIVREPLVRFLASYEDKLREHPRRPYYYKLITSTILAVKYPLSPIPINQLEWLETKNKTGLELTFKNMVEWSLREKLSGYDEDLAFDCSQLKHGCNPPKAELGGVRTRDEIDVHFQPQIFNC